MEFWSENQGQSHLYSNFGTVPGRNCTHNYHDRYQATHYPLHYGELQDQGRDSSYLTLAGSRTGGVPQNYTNWMGQELTASAPSHFPFIADSHPQQHQDLREYQPHEARDKEWTVAQRAMREYESGLLREGWQRRWEACNPDRYNREVSAKRSDSSYRELEAWAARYSHSLPRRRRIEAELRGSSQGTLESSRAPERDGRSGTDPRVAALQQAIQSANIRESGLWDRGSRQQALTNYTSQTPITGTSHMLDVKDKTGYKRRMVSHPPGYIAPPPYNSPHKSSPVLHHSDTSCEKEDKRQTYWSQPTIRKQDVSIDPRKGEEIDLTKPDVTQYTFPELEGLKHKRPEADALQASSPISFQNPHIKHEGMLPLRWPPALQAAQDQKINEEPSQKVIEGRKFRLNKKTGGMTIFCLVSRIAGATETPSLPLCTSATNTANTELGGVSKGLRDSGDVNQTHKLADEVDFRAPTLAEQSNISDVTNLKVTQRDTQTCEEKELSNKAETVSPEKPSTNDADSAFGRQISQPLSVKYPLWREPNFTSRVETESCLKANNEEGELDVLQNEDVSAEIHPTNIEVRRLDIRKDTKSDDSEGLLVIDTTCVVVKMELIPSPKKKQVYYFDSTADTIHSPLDIQSNVSPECVQSNSPLNQDETTDQHAETDPKYINERPEMELDSDLAEKKATEGESEISLPCMSSASGSEKETLEEHAEGILEIPQHYCMTEQEPRDARSLLDLCVEDEEPSPIEDNGIDNAAEEIPEDKLSQIQVEVDQTEDVVSLPETCNPTDKVTNDCGEDFERSLKQISALSEENNIDSQLQAPTPDTSDSPEIEMTEDLYLGSASEEGGTEQNQEEIPMVENETYCQHPSQCLSSPTTLSNSDSLLPSSNREAPDSALSLLPPSSDPMSLLYSSESPIEEGPDPEFIAHNSPENLAHYPVSLTIPQTPSEQMPSPLPPRTTDFAQSSTPHNDPSPGPSLPDSINLTASGVEDQDEECETSQLINNEISDDLDVTEELVLQQQFESGKPDNAACVKERNVADENQTKEPNKDPTDNIMEQIPGKSQDNGTKVNILLECVQEEDVACVTQSSTAEEQLPKEVNEDPIGLIEGAISQENFNESQTEANILQQLFDNGQEEDVACVTQSSTAEEQLPKEVNEDPIGLMEATISQENLNKSPTEVNILQQLFDNGQEEDVACVTQSSTAEEQLPKEVNEDPMGLMEATISQENLNKIQREANILQQLFDKGQEEDVACVTQSSTAEEQLPKEVNEDPIGLMEATISQENLNKSPTEVNILQQLFDNGQEEDVACVTQSSTAEEQLPKEVNEDPIGLMEATISQENLNKIQREANILQQLFDKGQEEDVACVTQSSTVEEQLPKEVNEDPMGLMEATISQENVNKSQTEANILQQLFDKGQEEDVACVTQSSTAEEQLPKEVNEDPIGLMEATISQENVNKSQTEANILQQLFDKGQEEDASCTKEEYMIEEQSHEEAYGDTAELLKKTISRKNATDSQTQKEMENLQDIEPQMEPSNSSPPSPSDFACEASQSSLHVLSFSGLPSLPQLSNKSDTEFASLSEMDSVCPSALNPVDDDDVIAAAIVETVPSPVHLDSCEESFKSTSSSNSPPVFPSSCTTAVLQEGSGCVSPDSSLKEEPQYPKSLWDAVNRIRKHTAPDSESEEEEASDLWDPVSVAEDLGCTDVVDNMDFEKRVSDEAEQQEISAEGSVDDIAVGKILQDPCHQEPSRHGEGDSQSCSSASSHSSEDTVIIADEDEFEEITPNAGRETKSVHKGESQLTEGERC